MVRHSAMPVVALPWKDSLSADLWILLEDLLLGLRAVGMLDIYPARSNELGEGARARQANGHPFIVCEVVGRSRPIRFRRRGIWSRHQTPPRSSAASTSDFTDIVVACSGNRWSDKRAMKRWRAAKLVQSVRRFRGRREHHPFAQRYEVETPTCSPPRRVGMGFAASVRVISFSW